jgi:hypothetical protein
VIRPTRKVDLFRDVFHHRDTEAQRKEQGTRHKVWAFRSDVITGVMCQSEGLQTKNLQPATCDLQLHSTVMSEGS